MMYLFIDNFPLLSRDYASCCFLFALIAKITTRMTNPNPRIPIPMPIYLRIAENHDVVVEVDGVSLLSLPVPLSSGTIQLVPSIE
jgi:hypothetical protein